MLILHEALSLTHNQPRRRPIRPTTLARGRTSPCMAPRLLPLIPRTLAKGRIVPSIVDPRAPPFRRHCELEEFTTSRTRKTRTYEPFRSPTPSIPPFMFTQKHLTPAPHHPRCPQILPRLSRAPRTPSHDSSYSPVRHALHPTRARRHRGSIRI